MVQYVIIHMQGAYYYVNVTNQSIFPISSKKKLFTEIACFLSSGDFIIDFTQSDPDLWYIFDHSQCMMVYTMYTKYECCRPTFIFSFLNLQKSISQVTFCKYKMTFIFETVTWSWVKHDGMQCVCQFRKLTLPWFLF